MEAKAFYAVICIATIVGQLPGVDEVANAASITPHKAHRRDPLSAKSPDVMAALRDTITFFEAAMVEVQLTLPCASKDCLARYMRMRDPLQVLRQIIRLRGLPGAIARLRRSIAAS